MSGTRVRAGGGVAVVVVGLVGCSVVAVQDRPAPPTPHRFVDPHRRPRAYGGGTCPLVGVHAHVYPPVPPAAFVDDHGAARDVDVDAVTVLGDGDAGVDAPARSR
jgi:hypothetical protein